MLQSQRKEGRKRKGQIKVPCDQEIPDHMGYPKALRGLRKVSPPGVLPTLSSKPYDCWKHMPCWGSTW
jgi:hypothetical protein